jgi:hypothetical protein
VIITLPGARSFKAGGMIRHSGKKQDLYLGISFTYIKPEDLEELKEYIKARTEQGQIVK